MDLYQKDNNCKEDTEFILLNLNKRVHFCLLSFFKLMFIGLLIQNSLISTLQIFNFPFYVPFSIFFILFIIHLINKISTKICDLITYLLIILFFDAFTIFVIILAYLVNDEEIFTRVIYYELCFSLMYLNINYDYSLIKQRLLMIYKLLIIVSIMIFYNYKKNLEKLFIFDLYMIILCFAMILVSIYMNTILWEKLKNNNVSLTNKLNSMFNMMKTPFISLN